MRAVNVAVIRDGKELLLFRKGLSWVLPGAVLEDGADDFETLERELRKGTLGDKIKIIEGLHSFKERTPYKEELLETRVYVAKVVDPEADIVPAGKRRKAKFVNVEDYRFSGITNEIVKILFDRGYIG